MSLEDVVLSETRWSQDVVRVTVTERGLEAVRDWGRGNEELFSGWRVSFWQDVNSSGIGLHENVHAVDTAELHGSQWFRSRTLRVYF